jgi:uncharacterized protein YabN with tetrapyrrole methylase and pyrophosphatase domain
MALQRANDKFETRFQKLEDMIKGREFSDLSMQELEEMWQKTKSINK